MIALNYLDNFGSKRQYRAEQIKRRGLAFHHDNEVSTGGGVSSSIQDSRAIKILQSLEKMLPLDKVNIKVINTASTLNDILGEEASQAILLLCEDLQKWDDEPTRVRAAYALYYIVNRTKPEVLIEVLKDKVSVVMESLIYALSDKMNPSVIIRDTLKDFLNVVSIVPKIT